MPTAGKTFCWSMALTGPGHGAARSSLQLYRNNRNGTVTDVTHAAGLDAPGLYGMGRPPSATTTTTDSPTHPRHPAWARIVCFRNTGKGTFHRCNKIFRAGQSPGIQHVGRCGLTTIATDALIFSSATTSSGPPEHDVFCSLDGKHKSYCTPRSLSRTNLLALFTIAATALLKT